MELEQTDAEVGEGSKRYEEIGGIMTHHAKLIIHGLPKMNRRQIKNLCSWLQGQVDEIKKEDPRIFSSRYTARLMK